MFKYNQTSDEYCLVKIAVTEGLMDLNQRELCGFLVRSTARSEEICIHSNDCYQPGLRLMHTAGDVNNASSVILCL